MRGCEISFEGPPQVGEQVLGQSLELLTIGATVGLGGGTIVPLAELHQQVERGHLCGFFDPLRQLRIDALDQATGIARAMAKPGGLEGILHHVVCNMRLRPRASGSGVISKSA